MKTVMQKQVYSTISIILELTFISGCSGKLKTKNTLWTDSVLTQYNGRTLN